MATFVYHRALLKALFYRYNLNLLAFSERVAERESDDFLIKLVRTTSHVFKKLLPLKHKVYEADRPSSPRVA